MYFDETVVKLIVPILPVHIWSLYVVFTRFSGKRRQARSERGTPDTKHARWEQGTPRHETRATWEAFPRLACLSLLARLRLPKKPETTTPVLQANCTLLSK